MLISDFKKLNRRETKQTEVIKILSCTYILFWKEITLSGPLLRHFRLLPWLAAAATFYYQNCAENFAGFILLQAAPLRLDEDECRKEAIFLSVVFQFPIKCWNFLSSSALSSYTSLNIQNGAAPPCRDVISAGHSPGGAGVMMWTCVGRCGYERIYSNNIKHFTTY